MTGLSDVPTQFAAALGIDVTTAMVIISVMILVAVGLILAVAKVNMIAMMIVEVALLGVLSLIGWFPGWIFVIIVLITAALFARQMNDWITGGAARSP